MKRFLVKVLRSNSTVYDLSRRVRRAFVGKWSFPARGALAESGSQLERIRHLARLRNFKSAASLIDGMSLNELKLADQILVVRCLYSAGCGVQADELLETVVRGAQGLRDIKAVQLADLAECVRFSGFQYERKEHLIGELKDTLEAGYPDTEVARFALNLTLFDLREAVDNSISPLDYIDLSSCSEKVLAQCSRAFNLLFSYGYHSVVYDYLNKCLARVSVPDLRLARLVVKFMPEWFVEHPDALGVVVSTNNTDITLLHSLYGHRREADCFESAYKQCYESVVSGFCRADVYRKDAILRFLLRCDFWDEALCLLEGAEVPDVVLSKRIIRGFNYLGLGDYGASLYCFQSVLEEDPADGHSAGGLRFAMPRAGFGMSAILDFRAKLGYGVNSAGRRGLLKSESEYSTSEAMAGNYLDSFYAKRNLKQWQILGRLLGDRFYSYRFLPDTAVQGKVYIIADEGVGDEIRSSQFYGYIQERFRNVVASCDPRLINVFSRSFPGIRFLPVRRVRKIMATRSDTQSARLVGVHDSVSRYFDDEAYSEMAQAEYVLFGQNLMFYRLSGAIPRPELGGYLRWDRSSRIANKFGKLKIGILWRSHLMVGMRKLMYLRIEDFAPLTRLEGVEIWSIQHAMTESETQVCRELGIHLLDDVDLFNDFEAMAGCLLGLDLLIGISSVPMELGAALGIETWMLGFSPENYYLRTAGGTTEVDQLTLNSTVVAPAWIDFTQPQSVCIREVFDEVKRRLEPRLASMRSGDTHL